MDFEYIELIVCKLGAWKRGVGALVKSLTARRRLRLIDYSTGPVFRNCAERSYNIYVLNELCSDSKIV